MPCTGHDLAIDGIAHGEPAHHIGGHPALPGDPDSPLDRYPAHQPRVGEVLAATPRLPDALVGLLPVLAHPLDYAREVLPGIVGDGRGVLVVKVDRVDELSVDVQLQLPSGGVANSHRPQATVSFEVAEDLLGELGAPVDVVHDLQRSLPRRPALTKAF